MSIGLNRFETSYSTTLPIPADRATAVDGMEEFTCAFGPKWFEKDAPRPSLQLLRFLSLTTTISLAAGSMLGGRIISSGKAKSKNTLSVSPLAGFVLTPAQLSGEGEGLSMMVVSLAC